MVSEVPIMTIEDVFYFDNSSLVPDEVLKANQCRFRALHRIEKASSLACDELELSGANLVHPTERRRIFCAGADGFEHRVGRQHAVAGGRSLE